MYFQTNDKPCHLRCVFTTRRYTNPRLPLLYLNCHALLSTVGLQKSGYTATPVGSKQVVKSGLSFSGLSAYNTMF